MTPEPEKKKEYTIPKSHPRYKSLRLRELIADGVEEGLTAPEGLIAHGRGEAFDYLMGECTQPPAEAALKAAAAALLLAKNPVLSVNGNVAALAPDDIVKLSKIIPAKVEVNIFHYSKERFAKILKVLADAGSEEVLGADRDKVLPALEHARAACTFEGIYSADVVLVPLEDGDRAKTLCDMGKTVITIDLNPLSRTAKVSDITIVDNLVRAIPKLIAIVGEFKAHNKAKLESIIHSFDNDQNLREILKIISERLGDIKF